MNQKGFATLEIILMVMVIGILATMAVPQFEKITAAANTSKVQSDLAAINTAAAVYQMETGETATYDKLTTAYFENGKPTEPTGKVYVVKSGTAATVETIDGWKYEITGGKATFGGFTADKFITKTS